MGKSVRFRMTVDITNPLKTSFARLLIGFISVNITAQVRYKKMVDGQLQDFQEDVGLFLDPAAERFTHR